MVKLLLGVGAPSRNGRDLGTALLSALLRSPPAAFLGVSFNCEQLGSGQESDRPPRLSLGKTQPSPGRSALDRSELHSP